MFIPFISKRAPRKVKILHPRKGGGGGGKGGGGKGAGGSGGAGAGSPHSTSISVGGTTKTATAFGTGGGKSAPIPAGQPFAGRDSGGGTRAEIYGTSQYGSGYPGGSQRGVAGLGFPFVFWPIAWGGVAGIGAGAYLHTSEYGRPDNSSRPGGPLTTATFVSSSNSNTTFRLLADNATTVSLISDIQVSCSNNLNNGSSSFVSTPYDDSLSSLPQAEQTVQYYRASTVALTLDGYNNTAVFEPEGTPDVPLPSKIDTTLLSCLNTTIGAAVPLISGVGPLAPNMSILVNMAQFATKDLMPNLQEQWFSTARIPDGQPFAGRYIGGGTRMQIYGDKLAMGSVLAFKSTRVSTPFSDEQYGSGYP
ncbi:hypothetical protein C0995_009101 [Termitomyces sp. Mi166|nr:hypothetical protein C0995_009101 [Termitomyces sp. Mi166\